MVDKELFEVYEKINKAAGSPVEVNCDFIKTLLSHRKEIATKLLSIPTKTLAEENMRTLFENYNKILKEYLGL